MSLLDEVASFENLILAHRECSRRKRLSGGYLRSVYNLNESVVATSESLLTGKYRWGRYRRFYVTDPKRRLIMAAPFWCRVVHHAIHRVIFPHVDAVLSDSVFACRLGRGNRHAAQVLLRRLQAMGPERYVLKLDVSKYFQSIRHDLLMERVMSALPDGSLRPLLTSLLASHSEDVHEGRGIPIGNLTSQLFANFYLAEVDREICSRLEFPYFWLDEARLPEDVFFIRYMDDLVLVGRRKSLVCEAAAHAVRMAGETLSLEIPRHKRMHIGADPVPFLGYVLSERGHRPLSRNVRKIRKKLARMEKRGARPSTSAQVRVSYEAWLDLTGD